MLPESFGGGGRAGQERGVVCDLSPGGVREKARGIRRTIGGNVTCRPSQKQWRTFATVDRDSRMPLFSLPQPETDKAC